MEQSNMKVGSVSLPKDTILKNRYVVQDVLGIGGFGITYKCYDRMGQCICAIKELFINDCNMRLEDNKTVAPYENRKKLFEHGIKRFMEEASILKALNGTANVVNIIDYFQENNTAYFVMEYISGPTLKGLLAIRGGRLPFQEACQIIYKVGKTLDYIHRNYGILHRDLSPENILIRQDGEPVMIDFGNAKNYIRNSGESMSVVLKPGFAPPEQYTGKNQGPWTDIYSLAGVFYYIATGKKIPASTDRLTGASYIPLNQVIPECPEKLSEQIDEALLLPYDKRSQNITQLIYYMKEKNNIQQEKPLDSKNPYIIVCDGGRKTQTWKIPENVRLLAGRDFSTCNIVFTVDFQISKTHFVIEYLLKENMFELTDTSTNGTFLDNQRLVSQRPIKVRPGTVVTLGMSGSYIKVGVDS